jgi:hypothetical protein
MAAYRSTEDRLAWRVLQRPDEALSLLLELPIGLSAGMATFVAWVLFGRVTVFPLSFEAIVGAFVGVTVLHAAILRVALPRGVDKGRMRTGRRSAVANATSSQPVSRLHYVAGLLLPLMLLSALPSLIAASLPAWRSVLLVPSVVNALVSAGDLLLVVLVLAQIPATAAVGIHGGDVAWRPANRGVMPARQKRVSV